MDSYNTNGNISFYEKFNKDKMSHDSKVFYYESGNIKMSLPLIIKRRKPTSIQNIMKMATLN